MTCNPFSERPVRIAAKLYECRESIRVIMGDRFAEAMKEHGDVLRAMAKAHDIDVLQAAMKAAKEVNGYGAVMFLAAAVELIEPSGKRTSKEA